MLQSQLDKQNCQLLAPQQRQCVPERHSHEFPGRSAQAPQVQDDVHVCWEQPSQLPARVAPGVQVPPPTQLPNAVYAPHVHVVESHVRVRVMVPHPQAAESVCTIPATQTPSPSQVNAVQWQSVPQARVCVPHIPQAAPVPMVPAMHSPSPVQPPEFTQAPPLHTCICMPHIVPQASIRGGSPVWQSHTDGALHGIQVPSMHCSIPGPHALAHERSAMRPMEELASSQSTAVGTPSWSASEVGE